MGTFKIDVDNFEWIGGVKDDPNDLCLHGHVKVQIGDTILEDTGTVSATALYLLKTLTEDKIMSEYDIQMVPCCGHTLLANEDMTSVMILGCDTGTDWTTIHEGLNVKIILPTGQEEKVSLEDYRKEVFAFVDKVEDFYNSCTQKNPPHNEWDRNGYIAFWNEWHRLRRKVYGAVSIEDENYYTYLKKVFDAIGNKQKEYNWLITDCVCYPDNPKTADMFRKEYCWISGEKLTELIEKEEFQWIWAVLSAFDKSIEVTEILKYDLPYAEDYEGFWCRPITMQHPLSKIEIVPWDSSMTMIFSSNKDIIDSFRAYYPKSEDFEEYIDRCSGNDNQRGE